MEKRIAPHKVMVFIIITILGIAIIISIPIIIERIFFSARISVALTDSEWVSFFGSYIASSITLIASVIGILITIRFTAKQNREDRRLQVAPCFSITFKKTEKLTRTQFNFDNVLYSEQNAGTQLTGILSLKNVGFGPVIDCVLSDIRYNESLFPRAAKTLNVNALETGGQWDVPISLGVVSGIIPKECLKEYDDGEILPSPNDVNRKSRSLKVTINYKDVLNTWYKQTVNFNIPISCIGKDGIWRYEPDIILVSITSREITKKPIENQIVPMTLQIK